MTADTVVAELHNIGVKAPGYEIDLTNAKAVQDAVDLFVREFGSLDAVICNAGGGEALWMELNPPRWISPRCTE